MHTEDGDGPEAVLHEGTGCRSETGGEQPRNGSFRPEVAHPPTPKPPELSRGGGGIEKPRLFVVHLLLVTFIHLPLGVAQKGVAKIMGNR